MFKKLLLLVTLITTITVGQNMTGDGSVGNPWIIYQANQLDSFDIRTGYFELGNDIDLQGDTLTRIELSAASNPRILDGKGYAIKNGYLNSGLYYFAAPSIFVVHDIHFRDLTVFRTAAGFTGLLGGAYPLENVTVKKCTLEIFSGSTSDYQTLLGGSSSVSNHFEYTNIGIDSCVIIRNDNGQPYNRAKISFIVGYGIGTFTNCYIKNSRIEINDADVGSSLDVNIGLFYGTISNSTPTAGNTLLYNCYAYNNVIKSVAQLGSNSNYWSWTTGLLGEIQFVNQSVSIENIYVENDTIITPTSTYTTTAQLFGGVFSSTDIGNDTITFINSFVGEIDSITVDTLYTVIDNIGNTADWIITSPTRVTDSSMQVTSTFTGWDFTNVWGRSPNINDGRPFLRWEFPQVLVLQTPILNETFYASDIVNVTWDTLGVDTVKLYYSDDSGFSWNYIDTAIDTFYNWMPVTVSGTIQIMITSLDSSAIDVSDPFIVFSISLITILSPLDQTDINQNGSLTVNILVQTINIDQFSLFYAINDTTNWVPIELDIPVNIGLDTTTVTWNVPNIYGQIWLLAREISDTTLYPSMNNWYSVGNIKRSWPAICWGSRGGTSIEYFWIVDQLCGWGTGARELVTALIGDYANQQDAGYTFSSYYGTVSDPNLINDGVYLYTALDTTYTELGTFYTEVSTDTGLTYLNRYYYLGADTMVYFNDIINNIDSIPIGSLTPFITSNTNWGGTLGWTEFPSTMQLYHVQRSKIQNQYFPVNYDFHILNDEDFIPVLLFRANAYGGGAAVRAIPLIDYAPNPSVYVQDIARLYTSLTSRRDYFRGIDPKARKSGR